MIKSPCIRVCILDRASQLCTGCGRSLDEINRWSKLTDTERDRIIAELPGRPGVHSGSPTTVS